MTLHDWTRLEDGLFHSFHQNWASQLYEALNTGGLPDGYYCRLEQHFGRRISDLLTLFTGSGGRPGPDRPPTGAVAVADAPPDADAVRRMSRPVTARRRTLVVRREPDEIVALVEIVSLSNKDRPESVTTFADKVAGALRAGIHVALIDLTPPGRHLPDGWPAAIAEQYGGPAEPADPQPADRPLAFLSYVAGEPDADGYFRYRRVGDPVPDIPLFLTADHYISLPLADTYARSFRALPPVDRDRLTGPTG